MSVSEGVEAVSTPEEKSISEKSFPIIVCRNYRVDPNLLHFMLCILDKQESMLKYFGAALHFRWNRKIISHTILKR